jgi:hypothetical protein
MQSINIAFAEAEIKPEHEKASGILLSAQMSGDTVGQTSRMVHREGVVKRYPV